LKKLTFLLFVISSFNTFALTEDYILYSRAEIAQQTVAVKKAQSEKKVICDKYSLSQNIKESCLSSRKSNELIKACLSGTSSEISQSFCLISTNITAALADSCYGSTSSEKSEVACLVLANKKVVKSESTISGCAGLGAMEEITCLKFQK